jgi:hypothetical protein
MTANTPSSLAQGECARVTTVAWGAYIPRHPRLTIDEFRHGEITQLLLLTLIGAGE